MEEKPTTIIPRAALPDFNAVGLYVYKPTNDLGPPIRVVCDHYELNVHHGCWIDAVDASTRDRLSRWAARRLNLTLGTTAPRWFNAGCGLWGLSSGVDRNAWFMPTRTPESVAHIHPEDGTHMLPTLWDLDHSDPTLLSDGSRRVSAISLARACIYLGGLP